MSVARKVDLVRLHPAEYLAPRKPRLITVGKAQYLAIRGEGTPQDELFQTHVCVLNRMAYALKRAKKKLAKDFKVCPLEGLWLVRGEGGGGWIWKLLVRVPSFVQRRDLTAAAAAPSARACGDAAAAVKLEQLKEGRCFQMLHLGPYATVGSTLERMKRAAQEAGLALHGPCHQIYLSDPRQVPSVRLRTILRQPVRAAR